jgi:hypothetical protein
VTAEAVSVDIRGVGTIRERTARKSVKADCLQVVSLELLRDGIGELTVLGSDEKAAG